MKLPYLLVTLVFLSCSCEDRLVDGIAVLNGTEATAEKPHLLIQPRILIAKKPIDVNGTDNPARRPQIEPMPTLVKKIQPKSEVQKNLDRCAHAPCPLIFCENHLPPIPSQGICCQRCVTNPNCNASACPQYKCGTYLIPANFTAGECCDRCAPATATPKDGPVKTQPITSKSKKTERSSSSSSSSSSSEQEEEKSNESSSSEENEGGKSPCNLRPFHGKQHNCHFRLIRLLTETLSQFRYHHGYQGGDSSSESEED